VRKILVLAAASSILIAAAVAATAAIPDANGVIHGCRNTKTGALRVIDTDKGQTCTKDEAALTWNQAGPQGPPGPQGVQGPAGANGVSGYEIVTQDFPLIGSNMHQVTVNCPGGKVPLGGAFALSAGPTWNPSLIGGYGVPASELTATGYNVWAQSGATSYTTLHVTITCAVMN
jgi:hypothetical protein